MIPTNTTRSGGITLIHRLFFSIYSKDLWGLGICQVREWLYSCHHWFVQASCCPVSGECEEVWDRMKISQRRLPRLGWVGWEWLGPQLWLHKNGRINRYQRKDAFFYDNRKGAFFLEKRKVLKYFSYRLISFLPNPI